MLRNQVERPAGDQHPGRACLCRAGVRGAGDAPPQPAAPEAASLGNQETWSLRQQSHQGVELIACHPLIACLHLTRMQEPVKERGSLHRLRGSLVPTPRSAVSHAAQHSGWVLLTLRPTRRRHPARHSPQWGRFAPSSPNLKPGLPQTRM